MHSFRTLGFATLLAAAAVLALNPNGLTAQEALGNDAPDAITAGSSNTLVGRATRLSGASEIDVDGRIDDSDWARVPVMTDFVQREPVEGARAEEQTEVKMLFDDEALYVAARMYDSEPQTIARQLVRRDEWGQYDYFEVGLDPNLDRRTGYLFRVSAANVQRDEYLFNDGNRDDAWDAVWASAVQVDSLGWTVEMRIPLSQIRYEASDGPTSWGVNFNRQRLRTREQSQFKLISRTQRGVVSQFAQLDGVRIEGASRRVELRPYLLSSAYSRPAEVGNPFEDGSGAQARFGTDLRYGIGSQFTLDATINPDFGQVEADPAVINLSAFETFFQERRPFFVEDARVFDFSLSGRQNRLFYSRRVGRSPQGSRPSEASFTDVPDAATIVGAVKLTGRTSSGLSVGGLFASTNQETGTAFFEEDGTMQTFTVEPRTYFGVARLRQDFNDGASTIGGIGTVLDRTLPGDGSFDFLPSNAFSMGLDWEHQWNDREWAFYGYVAGSHVRGDSTAMIRLQRKSNHFFQRPDSRWLAMDSTATTMSGIDWRMTVERRRGEHWTGSIWAAQVTSGFEVNDLGFSSRQEVLDGGMRVTYREIEPGERLRSYNITLSTFHNWSHDALREPLSWESWGRAHVNGSLSLRGDTELANFWRVNGNVTFRPERSDRTATRGGPLMTSPRSMDARLGFQTDRRKRFSFGPNVSMQKGALDSESRLGVGMGVSMRPSSQVEVELEPSWSSSKNAAQYVTSTTALPFEPTFGRRYLFADLERTELSLQTRLNVAFNNKLSLQLFAQPLLSSGDYVGYKQFLAPETFQFDEFESGSFGEAAGGCVSGRTCVDGQNTRYVDFDGDGTPDTSFSDRSFNVRSLVGNAVLRWEYMPGSTVFLVWQRQQLDRVDAGDFAFRRDLSALLDAPADNVFMVKVNYWLGL